jgi:hypothetical protein
VAQLRAAEFHLNPQPIGASPSAINYQETHSMSASTLGQLAAKAEATCHQLVEDLVEGKKISPDLCQPVAAAVGKTLRDLSNIVNRVSVDKRAQDAYESKDWDAAISTARTTSQTSQANLATAKAAFEQAQTALREAHQRAEAASAAVNARMQEKLAAEREFKQAPKHVGGNWRNFDLNL